MEECLTQAQKSRVLWLRAHADDVSLAEYAPVRGAFRDAHLTLSCAAKRCCNCWQKQEILPLFQGEDALSAHAPTLQGLPAS